ncbi:MAG: hypothetical protein LM582_00255 [Desulfurococcaceae archaeon]|nr:hypothetical protein [Desulfurococcaceae archaeon]
MNIIRLVLEIAKPIKSLDIFSMIKHLENTRNIKSIQVKSDRVSSESQTLILVLEGENLDYNVIAKTLEELNITVTNVIEIQALVT